MKHGVEGNTQEMLQIPRVQYKYKYKYSKLTTKPKYLL